MIQFLKILITGFLLICILIVIVMIIEYLWIKLKLWNKFRSKKKFYIKSLDNSIIIVREIPSCTVYINKFNKKVSIWFNFRDVMGVSLKLLIQPRLK